MVGVGRVFAAVLAAMLLLGSCGVDTASEFCAISTDAEVQAANEAQDELEVVQSTQVLTTTQTLPAGVTVAELLDAPTVYLMARVAPPELTCPSTITTVAQLLDMADQMTAVQVEPGWFLDQRQFTRAVVTPTPQDPPPPPVEAPTTPEPIAPEQAAPDDVQMQQVLVVTNRIAAGTRVTELLEAPSNYLQARAVPEQFDGEGAISSIAHLSEFQGWFITADLEPGLQLTESHLAPGG